MASPAAPARPTRPPCTGPYIQWTRTVNGKTVTRRLTPAQYDTYAPWFTSTRRLRALTAELTRRVLKTAWERREK